MALQDFIFIDDYAPVLGFFNPGKKTKLIQVWHAGEGFKSVGYSRFGKEGSPFPSGSCHKKYNSCHNRFGASCESISGGVRHRERSLLSSGNAEAGRVPRPGQYRKVREGFYREYPFLKGRKIILFAPTYRGSEQKEAYYDYDMIDLERIYGFCREEDTLFW